MIIKNGTLLNDSFVFENKDLEINGEKIAKISENLTGTEEIDASGMYVVPGFIDSHTHGAMGVEYWEGTEGSYAKMSEFEGKNGTTGIFATISAAVNEKMIKSIKGYKANKNDAPGAKFLGIHLEGPFFNVAKKGAHLHENIRNTTVEEFKTFIEAGGEDIKIITLAPELPNAEETIKYIVNAGTTVTMGHSDATYDEAEKGVQWGVTRSTHTFNAMSALNHRNPGVVGSALTNDKVDCELICDFFHVHPAVCKMVFDLKGADKVIMITDSVVGAGLPDGKFREDSKNPIIVKDKKTYLLDGTIAGGSTCLIDGVRNMVSVGVSLADAVKAATINPAKSVHMEDKVGSLKEGKFADIVILDKDLNVKYVFVNGKLIHKA